MSRHPISGQTIRDLEDARTLLSQWQAAEEPLATWCRRHDIKVCSPASYKRWVHPAVSFIGPAGPDSTFLPPATQGLSNPASARSARSKVSTVEQPAS